MKQLLEKEAYHFSNDFLDSNKAYDEVLFVMLGQSIKIFGIANLTKNKFSGTIVVTL